MATNNIVITVSQTGAQGAGQAIAGIGTSAKSSQTAVDQLTSAMKALGATLAIEQLKEWSDVWTRATGLVNIFSKSQAETNLILSKLYDIANNTRQSLEGTVKAYHQMAISGAQLAASQNDILAVTNLVGQAFAIQATPTNVAKAAIIQLSHSFTEGIVRGRQFNALLIDSPRLLQVAADHIDGANGSVGKLRQIMLAGNLTSKDFFAALVKGAGDLQPLFDKTGKTFGQAFTILENAAIKYVGTLTQAGNVSTGFYQIAKLVADNIDILAKSLLALASPFILNGLIAVGAALKDIAIWALANPFVAIAGALVIATTAAILFKDQIIVNQDEQLTLGDYISAVGAVIADVFGTTGPQNVNIFKASFLGLIQFADDVKRKFLDLKATITGSASAVNATDSDSDRYAAFNRLIQQKIDLEGKIANINQKPSVIKYFLTGELEDYQQKLNTTIGLLGQAADDQKKLQTGVALDKPKTAASASTGGLLDDLTARAKLRRDQRAKDQADELKQQQEASKQLANPLGAGADFSTEKKGPKAPKDPLDNPYKLQQAYTGLLNKIQPLAGALEEYKNAEDILDHELAAGNITSARKAELLDLVNNHYRDILDPVGAYTRNLDRENQFLKLNSEEREVAQKLYTDEEALRKQGITLSDDIIAKLKEEIEANQELTRVTQVRDGIYKDMVNTSRQYADELTAIAQLQADPKTDISKLQSQVVTKGPNSDLFAGTQEAITANEQNYKDMYAYIDGLQRLSVISAQTASVARVRVFQQEQTNTLQGYSSFFGTLAQLRTADGKSGSKLAKAAAIAQATINTYTAATGAYASASAIPFVGWVLGPIAAAAAIAVGLQNVAQIRSQNTGYKDGGYTGNIGINSVAGPVHGQEYVMDAATTARIGVHNLDALRNGDIDVGKTAAVPVGVPQPQMGNVKVLLIDDQRRIGDYMQSDEGERIVMTHVNNQN